MLDALLNLKPSVTSWTLYTTTYLKSPWIFVCLAIELSADSFGENRNDDNSSAQAHRQNLQCPLGFVGAIGSESAARRAVSVRWRTTAPWIRQACGDSGQKIVLKRKNPVISNFGRGEMTGFSFLNLPSSPVLLQGSPTPLPVHAPKSRSLTLGRLSF